MWPNTNGIIELKLFDPIPYCVVRIHSDIIQYDDVHFLNISNIAVNI